MSINSIPEPIFYAPQSWIDLAPDYDWDELAEQAPDITVVRNEYGVLAISGEGVRRNEHGAIEITSEHVSRNEYGALVLDPKG